MTHVTTEQAPPAVGTVFRCSWGYDQTNVDWYQVARVSKSGASVTLVPVGSRVVDESGSTTHVVPDLRAPAVLKRMLADGCGMRRKLYRYSDHWSVSVASYAVASEWDGEPAYETAVGWGH